MSVLGLTWLFKCKIYWTEHKNLWYIIAESDINDFHRESERWWLSLQCLAPLGHALRVKNKKNTAFLLCFLVAGPRMFQSPGGLLLTLSVWSHCTQESCLRKLCRAFIWAVIKPSFAVLNSVHENTGFCGQTVSKSTSVHEIEGSGGQDITQPGFYVEPLSATETPMDSPFGKAWCLYTKKTQRIAVLSCSGTQDWTADLMIMNWFRW